jgi:hypothetical protein
MCLTVRASAILRVTLTAYPRKNLIVDREAEPRACLIEGRRPKPTPLPIANIALDAEGLTGMLR